jgi:hypothetical protein
MFRTPPGGPLPPIPTGAEQIARFGLPVAMLAESRPDWRLLVGIQGTDDVTTQLDVLYAAARSHLLQVTTARPHPRTLTLLSNVLSNFAMNADHRPAGLDTPSWLASWDHVRTLPTTPATLRVDGTDLPARRMSFDGFFGIEAALGELQVFVCGRAEAEPPAAELVTGHRAARPGVPPPHPRRHGLAGQPNGTA